MDHEKIIENLVGERAALVSKAEEIHGKTTEEWSAEERQFLERVGQDIADLELKIESTRNLKKAREWDDAPRDDQSLIGDPDDDEPGDPTPRGNGNDNAVMRQARQTARAAGWGQAISEYMDGGARAAIMDYVRNGELSEASRAFLSEDATGGGYLVPPMPLIQMLIEEQRNNVFIEELSEVATIGDLKGHTIARLDARPSDPDWTSETPAAGSVEDQMAFGRLRFEPQPMRGLVAEFSADELVKDEIDIEAVWRDNLQYLVGVKKENAYLTGDGVRKPVGIFSDVEIGTDRDVKTGSNDALTFEGLVNALFGLKEQYQMRSTWVIGRKAMAQVFGLQDNDGRPVWQSVSMGPGGDYRGMILNRPYRLSEYVPNANKATDFAANDYVAVLGDFRAGYRVLRTTHMRLVRNPYTKDDENIIRVATRFYGDGKPKLAEAFVRLKTGA